MQVGRNEPCLCGSGKKYKNCCLNKTSNDPSAGGHKDTMRALHEFMHGEKFTSLEDAQAAADRFMRRRNQQGIDDFHGLSSEQMYRMLNFTFESLELLTFTNSLEKCSNSPMLDLFGFLADALGENGLKATKTGNLPRGFCRDAEQFFEQASHYGKRLRIGKINQEPDFFDLHTVRVVSELAGLVKQQKNRYVLTRKCHNLLDKQGLAGVFPILLRTFSKDYNWSYGDHYPEFYIIQQSFAYSLYLLTRYGDEWKPNTFYEDCFIRAFPAVLQECEPNSYLDPETQVRKSYNIRCLERFMAFLGLAELQYTSEKFYDNECRIRSRPLLSEVVKYHI